MKSYAEVFKRKEIKYRLNANQRALLENEIGREIAFMMQRTDHLAPSTFIEVDRVAYADPKGSELRITFDSNLACVNGAQTIDMDAPRDFFFDEPISIMEVKNRRLSARMACGCASNLGEAPDMSNGAQSGQGEAPDMNNGAQPSQGEAPDMNNGAQPSQGEAPGAPEGNGETGMDLEDGNENCKIIINGGSITLEAKGDAIDSNGYLEINGGTIYVTGPTSGGDGALDFSLDAQCNGGTMIIVGSSGIAQNFSGGTQPFAMRSVKGSANQVVSVLDSSAKTLMSYTPTAAIESIIVSSPNFVEGQSYTLKVGDVTTTIVPSTTASSNAPGK